MKIENIELHKKESDIEEFVNHLKKLQPRQSFLWDITSYHRTAVNLANYFLNGEFIIRKEKNKFRVGRIK